MCRADEAPFASESGQALGRHLNGYRIGFDLGTSDLKVSAVVDGEPIFSDEIVWEPVEQTDPAYHYSRITARFGWRSPRCPGWTPSAAARPACTSTTSRGSPPYFAASRPSASTRSARCSCASAMSLACRWKWSTTEM